MRDLSDEPGYPSAKPPSPPDAPGYSSRQSASQMSQGTPTKSQEGAPARKCGRGAVTGSPRPCGVREQIGNER
eukprot:4872665-Pyramimonas_sp.AAC.2